VEAGAVEETAVGIVANPADIKVEADGGDNGRVEDDAGMVANATEGEAAGASDAGEVEVVTTSGGGNDGGGNGGALAGSGDPNCPTGAPTNCCAASGWSEAA